jgi:hypothetical protein
MHKNATKCNETVSKWCKNKHGASKIIDTFETYQKALPRIYSEIMVGTQKNWLAMESESNGGKGCVKNAWELPKNKHESV